MRRSCFSDGEKLLKYEAEGREFANVLRSLELIQRVKGQHRQLFQLVPGGFSDLIVY